jgi:hypothetical protein
MYPRKGRINTYRPLAKKLLSWVFLANRLVFRRYGGSRLPREKSTGLTISAIGFLSGLRLCLLRFLQNCSGRIVANGDRIGWSWLRCRFRGFWVRSGGLCRTLDWRGLRYAADWVAHSETLLNLSIGILNGKV